MQGMWRAYETLINEYLHYFPCVVLVGARQTGKSTLIESMSAGREIFDLESQADFEQIHRDPDLFLRLNNHPLAIDEAQLLPALFPALRVAIDRNRNHYGKYLLSGSSSPALLTAISESLAGRVGIIEIAPFSLTEIQGIAAPYLLQLLNDGVTAESIMQLPDPTKMPTNIDIDRYWLDGGYPEPVLRGSQQDDNRFRELWYQQYLKTYVERDIAALFPRLDAIRFRRFIALLAGCSGIIINYANIARLLDVSQPTAKDYFRIAEGTFLWRQLPAWHQSQSKRLVKHPRGFLRDSGLLHHLLQLPNLQRLQSHPQMGNSWEGMVVEEILRILNAAGLSYTAYTYRTAAGAEVDIILEGVFGLLPIEIKHTQTVNSRHLRALRDFVQDYDCPFGIVVNRDEKVRRYDERLVGIPFSWLIGNS